MYATAREQTTRASPAARRQGKARPLPAGAPLLQREDCACGGNCPKCQAADPAGHAPSDSRSPARDVTGTGGGSGSGGGSASGGCGTTKTVAIDFVKLRGASRNPTTDLAFANTVFAPACVQFTSAGTHTVTNAQSDGWLGDTDLASGVCPITAEETSAYSGSISAFSLSSRLKAFYVVHFSVSNNNNVLKVTRSHHEIAVFA